MAMRGERQRLGCSRGRRVKATGHTQCASSEQRHFRTAGIGGRSEGGSWSMIFCGLNGEGELWLLLFGGRRSEFVSPLASSPAVRGGGGK